MAAVLLSANSERRDLVQDALHRRGVQLPSRLPPKQLLGAEGFILVEASRFTKGLYWKRTRRSASRLEPGKRQRSAHLRAAENRLLER